MPPTRDGQDEERAEDSPSALELVSAVSPETSAAPTVEDGGPAAESAMAASPDSSPKLSENDGSPDVATPSWDGILRRAGLRSDPMRMGWIVAFALLLTLGLAICTREQDATTRSGEPVASADAGYGSEVRG